MSRGPGVSSISTVELSSSCLCHSLTLVRKMEAEFYQQFLPLCQSSQQTMSDQTSFHHYFPLPEGNQPQPGGVEPTAPANNPSVRNGSKKRRACNECKQQKLKCDLSMLVNTSAGNCCSRCRRLDLDCRIDRGFRRQRKRKRSDELEREVDSLRQELSKRVTIAPDPTARTFSDSGLCRPDNLTETDCSGSPFIVNLSPSSEMSFTNLQLVTPPESSHGSEFVVETPALFLSTTESSVGGNGDLVDFDDREPRMLDSIHLAADTIDELFEQYFNNYHTFLPILDPQATPTQYFNSSEFLFWAIVSVASRRYTNDATLLSKLAQLVTNLTWKTIQTAARSKYTVQGLALLCMWPFPTSDNISDVSYLWAGSMVQISMRIGFHRPLNLQDFNQSTAGQLSASGLSEAVRTWAACHIASQG